MPDHRRVLNGLLSSPLRNLLAGSAFMALVMATATGAYVACGWSLGDAVYMVVITVYTVGYDEVRPITTPELRGVTMGLVIFGCTGMIFLTGALVQLITVSQFQQLLGARRMQRDIEQLSDHVIVCGYGRIGVMLTRELAAGSEQFVVLERNEARLRTARDSGYLVLQGDATDEDVLHMAGVARARCLATVLPDDAANVFITLSARSLNPKLQIIARGEAASTERKLLQAGADRVVMPTHIGAERIADIILYPQAERLLHGSDRKEQFTRELRGFGLEMEVVAAAPGSRCVGGTIADLERAAAGSLLVVALNRRDGSYFSRPNGDMVIAPGDGLMVVGRRGSTAVLGELITTAA